jgi:hypothetical protein
MPLSMVMCNRWRLAAAQECPAAEVDREPEM